MAVRSFVPLVAAATMFISACAGEAGDDDPGTGAGPTKLTITATEFSFVFSPEQVPAGEVSTTLVNEGKQAHQALFYLLNDGVSFDEFVEKATADETQVPQLASGGRDGVARGGNPGTRVSHDDELEVGTYTVICFIRDVKSGKSHFELGMVGELQVK